jgi:hypothetical protein
MVGIHHSYADVAGSSTASDAPAAPAAPAIVVVSEVAPIIIVDNDEEDVEWNVEKEKCSFCRQFLQSPCKNQFRRWSKCVDLAKEKDVDFVKACSGYTNDLMDCTSLNTDYFAELNKNDDVPDSEEGSAADEETIPASSEEEEEEEEPKTSSSSEEHVHS